MVELWFLGTSAGRPIPGRNVSAAVLQLPPERGAFWLFDCGEGTQHQLLATPFRLSRLERIFITHLHGDHVFGLPGLLGSRSSLGASEPLDVYGPAGLREWIETSMRLSGSRLGYELRLHELADEGIVCEDERFVVTCAALDHRIDCFGYRIAERPRPGMLNTERLSSLGLRPGPLYGRLKRGEDVTLPDGTVVRSADVIGAPVPGRVVTILGDTRPCPAIARLAEGADVLVHEATFDETLAEKAAAYGHSTTRQAAEAARDAGARKLILTHFSTRFTDAALPGLAEEARRYFPETEAAEQLKPYPIGRARGERQAGSRD